jgi:hypothetical protein
MPIVLIENMKKSKGNFAGKCKRWTFGESRSAIIENGIGACGYFPWWQTEKLEGD